MCWKSRLDTTNVQEISYILTIIISSEFSLEEVEMRLQCRGYVNRLLVVTNNSSSSSSFTTSNSSFSASSSLSSATVFSAESRDKCVARIKRMKPLRPVDVTVKQKAAVLGIIYLKVCFFYFIVTLVDSPTGGHLRRGPPSVHPQIPVSL